VEYRWWSTVGGVESSGGVDISAGRRDTQSWH
jgi:hypothetical protein